MIDWDAIAAAISSATRQPFQFIGHTDTGGGCINQTYCLEARPEPGRRGRHFFIKLNAADKLSIFAAEEAGLNAIAATNTLRVPCAITRGTAGEHAFLVLEHLELNPRGNAALFGEQLAALHRCTSSRFGFAQDNFIGATLQLNTWTNDWIAFWCEHRLDSQLRLAAQNGYGGQLQSLGEQLMDALPAFFTGYIPQPSLLHGDLWSGNQAYLPDGTPVIFDPAPYYGDRECDLAMTELFGGFSADLYAAYRAAYPLDAGYSTRRNLYNLYHVLNHANLFGGGYARQAELMIRKLLAEVAG